VTRPKLTAPQAALLKEMQESHTGGLFIDKWRRYWRTAEALEAKGYIKREAVEFTGRQINHGRRPQMRLRKENMNRYELVDWTPERHPRILLARACSPRRRRSLAFLTNMELRKVGTMYINNGRKPR